MTATGGNGGNGGNVFQTSMMATARHR